MFYLSPRLLAIFFTSSMYSCGALARFPAPEGTPRHEPESVCHGHLKRQVYEPNSYREFGFFVSRAAADSSENALLRDLRERIQFENLAGRGWTNVREGDATLAPDSLALRNAPLFDVDSRIVGILRFDLPSRSAEPRDWRVYPFGPARDNQVLFLAFEGTVVGVANKAFRLQNTRDEIGFFQLNIRTTARSVLPRIYREVGPDGSVHLVRLTEVRLNDLSIPLLDLSPPAVREELGRAEFNDPVLVNGFDLIKVVAAYAQRPDSTGHGRRRH